MTSLNWIKLVDIIDSNLWITKDTTSDKINETKSIYSNNCFNCLNWEKLPWPDFWVLVQCEWLCISSWLKKTANTQACENYDPEFKEIKI